MRRRLTNSALVVVAILLAVILVNGSIPQPPTGTWLSGGSMLESRSGAAAALLQDGRILITGGDDGSGPVATAVFFDTTGAFVPAPAMSVARNNHISVVLQDGRVLVAGGTVAGGAATNAVEIYDPLSNTWGSLTGGITEARSGATAAVLKDGRVLVAGGQNGSVVSSTIEIFDPVAGSFSFAGALSSPRTQHGMAVLADGRVLIIGGFNGSAPLASSDIFDPVAGTVAPGPSMATPRSGHSATTLLDGRVLVAGGNNIVTNADGSTTPTDLASAEIFDPSAGTFSPATSTLAAPRQSHLGFLLPNNNNVLFVGGTSGGTPVASTELFTPWQGTFSGTGSLAAARSNAAGSALQQDGLLVVAGGKDATGAPLSSSELFGFATVKTDAADYPPGTTVNISGSGWKPSETVTLTLVESPLIDTHGPYTVTADAQGNISDSSFTTDLHDLNIRFYLTAVGSQSGSQAQTTFTDSRNWTLTFAGTGKGSVTITPNTGTVNAPTSCGGTNSAAGSQTVTSTCGISTSDNGAIVTLSASATGVSTFGGWSQSTLNSSTCSGTTNPCNGVPVNNAALTVTFNPGSASKYVVTSSNNNPAAGTQVTITAQLADSDGNVVPTSGKVVTWTSTNGSSFSSPTSNTNGSGVATVNFTVSSVAGTVHTVTATDNTIPTHFTGTSGNITAVIGPAARLVFLQQPTNAVAATTIAPAVTVREEDANGNLVTTDSATPIAISILNNPSGGTLNGTTTQKLSGGIATFNDLSINKAGTGYTLQAAHGGLTSATSSGFNITARSTSTVIGLNPPSVTVSGSSTVTVTVTDTAGVGTASNPTGTLALTSSDTGASGDTFTACTLAPSGANAATCTATVTAHEVATSPHTITATYTPTDTVHSTSNGNAALTVTNPATTTTVSSSSVANTSTYGDSVTFTATVASSAGTPTGTVTFIEGTTCPGVALTGSSPNPVTLAGGQATFTISSLSAGSHTITACYSPTGIFAASSGSVVQTVNKANAVITVTPYHVTYDGNSHTATGSAKGVETPTPVDLTSLLHLGGTTHTDAGDYPTDSWTFDGNTNYKQASGSVHDIIDQAIANITVTPYHVTYDGNSHTATGSAKGVETPTPVDLTSLLHLTGTAHTNAGDYPTDSWTFDGNTNYKQASGVVHDQIDKADAIISVTPYNITYDAIAHTATGTATGVESPAPANLSAQLTLSGTTHTNAGDYPSDAWTFAGGTNYKDANGMVHDVIGKRPITVTAASDSRVYDGTITSGKTPVISSALSPAIVGADSANFTQVFDSRNAGSRLLIPSGSVTDGNNGYNYIVNFVNVAGSITTRPITVTATTDGKVYDGTTTSSQSPVVTSTLSPAIVSGDSPNFTQNFDSRNAGSRMLIPSGSVTDGNNGSNYSVNLVNTAGSIATRPITVTAVTDTKTFDGTTTSSKTPGVGSNLNPAIVTGDTAMFTQAFDTPNAGNRMLIPSGSVSDGNGGNNYSVYFKNTSGTINAALTSTMATSSVNPSVFQQSVTFTAKVQNTQTSPIPTGSVQFVVDGVNFGSPVSLVGGMASISSSTLAVNAHTVQANFLNADGNFANSGGSLAAGQVVNKASTTTALSSSANPSILNQSVTFTAAVTVNTPGSGSPTAPTGSVTFTDTTTSATIGTVPLGAGGTASITTSSLPVNANNITATYSGDGNFTMSASPVLTQLVQYQSAGTMCLGDAGHQILQPINANGTSVFNGKSTSPAKFRVCDANGVSIGTPGVVSAFGIYQIVSGTATTVNEDVASTTPDTMFRWDSTAQQWIFNINNKSYPSNQTYYFQIKLNDGSSILFSYGLK